MLPSSSALPLGKYCPGPRGWWAMVKAHPEERLRAPAEITLTQETLTSLLAVEHRLRTGWSYVPEAPGRDSWNARAFDHAAGTGRGDCEDASVAARQIAAHLGLPRGAFRLALCETQAAQGHCVLTVATDRGTFVIDQARQGLWGWADLPYSWISTETARYGWRFIKAPVTLADLAGAVSPPVQ